MLMKELYLDTADIGSIKRMVKTNAIMGFTTNPSLIAKQEKGDYEALLSQISDTIYSGIHERDVSGRHLSIEVTTLDTKEMVEQALHLHQKCSRYGKKLEVHVKIPVLKNTLDVITELNMRGVRVNATACMTALQAKIAADAGASVVSFFYNRMRDQMDVDGKDKDNALNEIIEFANLREGMQNHPKIICGSIRNLKDIQDCWNWGADIVTCSEQIIEDALYHPQTEKAVKKFQEDIEAWLK